MSQTAMPVRTQLLIAFVGITLLSLAIFGTVAYWLLPNALRTHNEDVLKSLSQHVAQQLDRTSSKTAIDDAALNKLRHYLTGPNTLIALRGPNDHVMAISRPDDIHTYPKLATLHKHLLTALHSIDDSDHDTGVVTVAGQPYLWVVSRLPGRKDTVTLVRPMPLELPRYGNALWTRLFATALFVMWIAVWAALVLSSLIVRRLNEKNVALAYQAHHDGLTGLPNRTLLNTQLTTLIEEAEQTNTPIALFVMDLDRFKEVNDTLGHPFGDELLKLVSMRVGGVLREEDTIARLGGDEFAVLLPGAGRKQAISCATRIVHVLGQPFSINGLNLHVKSGLGIALYPEHGDTVDSLIQHADTAMYKAKKARVAYRFYDHADDPHSVRRLTLSGDLCTAIEHDELVLHYQPKVDLHTGELRGVEALVRWEHPTLGLMPPDEFIPLAEQSGMVGELTEWILSEALRQCNAWRHLGLKLSVAVNLSAYNLKNAYLPTDVTALLQAWDVPPEQLVLEITESAMMEDYELATDIVHRLNEMGVGIAIDDFGTGFSSLAYLQRLPVHELKIDKSFVIGMDEPANDSNVAIVRSIIDLAHNIGCKVVAEGVETVQARDRLSGMRCDIGQGYFFSRPLSASELQQWLEQLQRMEQNAHSRVAYRRPAFKPA